MVSPKTAFPISQKYSSILSTVSKLEPSVVGNIFKHANNPLSFFPSIGLFSVEFALAYCNNMNYNKKIGELGSESLENPKTTQNKEINVLSNEETMPPARPRINKKNVTQKNKK
jgi:hypothetical protein